MSPNHHISTTWKMNHWTSFYIMSVFVARIAKITDWTLIYINIISNLTHFLMVFLVFLNNIQKTFSITINHMRYIITLSKNTSSLTWKKLIFSKYLPFLYNFCCYFLFVLLSYLLVKLYSPSNQYKKVFRNISFMINYFTRSINMLLHYLRKLFYCFLTYISWQNFLISHLLTKKLIINQFS
jgi:hypothetical protein